MKVTLVLPAYNEAGNLPPLLRRIEALRMSDPALREMEIVVVDDGSTDGTAELAVQSGLPGLTVIRHGTNRGLAAALRTGIHTALSGAAGDGVVVTLDADGTHDPADIPRLLRALGDGADVAIASRFAPGGRERGVPWRRRLLSRAAGLALRLACQLPIRDATSGYRAYRAWVARKLLDEYPGVFGTLGFSVTVAMLVAALQAGAQPAEVPTVVDWTGRKGRSKMRVWETAVGVLACAAVARRATRGAVPWAG